MERRTAAALIFGGVLLAGCGRKKKTVRKLPSPPRPAPRPGDTETGLASWYGHPYHGRAAANGEIYDMEKLTAAHRTLPFDTWVRVYNLRNSKTVDVRITDRGPFVEGRIIDLSHAAARQIELIGPGVAEVRIEILRPPEVVEPAIFAVQVGAFRNRANAETLCRQMSARYGSAKLVPRAGNPPVWRVLVGSEKSQAAAQALAAKIQSEGNEKNSAFVVRLDTV